MWDGNIEKSFWQRARIGIAPYLANYNDLNTWIMFQVDHHPAKHDHFVATPLIRFFYKTYLFEVGYSSNQHIMVNWTVTHNYRPLRGQPEKAEAVLNALSKTGKGEWEPVPTTERGDGRRAGSAFSRPGYYGFLPASVTRTKTFFIRRRFRFR